MAQEIRHQYLFPVSLGDSLQFYSGPPKTACNGIQLNGLVKLQPLLVPEGFIPKFGARVMSLQDPSMKMSKSDPNPNGFVAIMDDPSVIMKKFKRAVTDSDTFIAFDPENKPGVSNLMCIYSVFTGKTNAEIEAEFAGRGYGDFKLAVAEVTADALAPLQGEYARILADKAYVDGVL